MASFTRSTQLLLDGDDPILISIIEQGDTKAVGFNSRDLNGDPIDISGSSYAIDAICEFHRCEISGNEVVLEGGPYQPTDTDAPPERVKRLEVTKDANNVGRFTVRIPTDLWVRSIKVGAEQNPAALVYIQHGDSADTVETDKWLIGIDRGVPSVRIDNGGVLP